MLFSSELDFWPLSLSIVLLQWLESLMIENNHWDHFSWTPVRHYSSLRRFCLGISTSETHLQFTSAEQGIENAVGQFPSLKVWAPTISGTFTSLMPIGEMLETVLPLSFCLFLSEEESNNDLISTGFNATVAYPLISIIFKPTFMII